MAESFTAVLDVNRMTVTTPHTTGTYRGETPAPTREVSEVARIVVRADSLESLRAKLAAHVALID